jgi:ribosomal protein S18 acetylase RimI-like enzyme
MPIAGRRHGCLDRDNEDVITRVAVPDDAADIAAIHVQSWQVAYRGLLPERFLDSLDPGRRARGWRQSIENQNPPAQAAIVIADETQILGFAHIRPTRDDDEEPDLVGEVTCIYLRPEAWGNGLGRRLMDDARSLLRDAGNTVATLWVLEGNARAIHFYEANGWIADGATKRATIADTSVTEIRYRTTL